MFHYTFIFREDVQIPETRMRCLYILSLLLPVALANSAISKNSLLQARDSNSKIVCGNDKNKRNCADVTLRCRTGPNQDGFEVEISPVSGGNTLRERLVEYHPGRPTAYPHPHLYPHPPLTTVTDIPATGSATPGPNDHTFVGKMKDLKRESTSATCSSARAGNDDCSYAHWATVLFGLETPVPGSLTRLVWAAVVHVDLQCLVVPLNPEGVNTLPNVPNVTLSQCEHFNHTIQFFPVPEPADCAVTVKLDSNVARQGIGYTLQKCFLTLPGQSIPIITNGRTQKSARVEVTGRSVDGGSGLAYQLYLRGLSPAQVQAGSLRCEAARCRSSVVATENYAQCIQGALPTDFIASSGRAPISVLDTAGVTGSALRGDVKLYIPRGTTSRSSPSAVQECTARSGSVY